MALSRDDQNTFLMIGGVLIVCLIALIAVISSLWNIIRDPVNQVINTVSSFVRIQTLDYNFTLPQKTQANNPPPVVTPPSTEPPTTNTETNTNNSNFDKDIDYNFSLPGGTNALVQEAIISDAKLLELQSANQPVEQKNLFIQIPKLKINSPILQGINSEDLLKQGFWVVPSERKLGESEIILLCQRRYFGPNDPKSCWFLNQVAVNDSVVIKYNVIELKYKVVGINRFKADDPLVYQADPTEDLIRIVTTDPLYSNDYRLVVLAKRIS